MTTTNTQSTSAKTPSHVAYQVRDREGFSPTLPLRFRMGH